MSDILTLSQAVDAAIKRHLELHPGDEVLSAKVCGSSLHHGSVWTTTPTHYSVELNDKYRYTVP